MPQARPSAISPIGMGTVTGPASSPLVRVISPDEVSRTEAQEAEDKARAQDERMQLEAQEVSSLAAFVRSRYHYFRTERQSRGIDKALLHALRTFRGQYNPSMLKEIQRFGGSTAYSRMTAGKCRGASSLLREVYLSAERPWLIEPTPDPELPDDIQRAIDDLIASEQAELTMAGQFVPQEVLLGYERDLIKQGKKRTKEIAEQSSRMAGRKIEDIFIEGGFYDALKEFIQDLPIFPYAVLKGPIVRRKTDVKWSPGGEPEVRQVPKMCWERVSPFDFFWSPGASCVERAEVIERWKVSRAELNACRGVPGYFEEAIAKALDAYGLGGLSDWINESDTERAWIERKEDPQQNRSGLIDAVEYHGAVQGRMLVEGGVPLEQFLPSGTEFDPLADYMVQVILVGAYVIKVTANPDPLKRHPYYVTSYEKVPGAIAGHGLPEILATEETWANATIRSLINNMCLTGDTVVYRHAQPRKYAPVTLAELYETKFKHNSGLRRQKLRALNEDTGEFFGNRIVDIVDNGIADVFRVTTARGYVIKATGNHRFMRDDGSWQVLDEFSEGDLIAVNGQVHKLPARCMDCAAPLRSANSVRCRSCAGKQRRLPKPVCADCGVEIASRSATRCRSCAGKPHNNPWNREQVERSRDNRTVSDTTSRMRHLCQSQKKTFCQECDAQLADGAALEVHHIDRDPWNNAPENLRTLCTGCHHAVHAKEDSFGDPYLHRYVSYDQIVSIEYVGKERVYDLCMEAPHHNFVANGFVSHNSLSSGPMAVVDVDRLDPAVDEIEIYPWKRWLVKTDPIGRGSGPPIEFFQPGSNAQELLAVYNAVIAMADENSALPRYQTGGSKASGAARTASGLAMLTSASNRVLMQVSSNIDLDIIAPALQRLYDMIMLTQREPFLRGDEGIAVIGATRMAQKETERMRQLELLQMTSNPVDLQIIGPEGRAALLRQISQNVGLSGRDIVPSRDEIRLQQQIQPQPVPPASSSNPSPLPSAGGDRPGAETDNMHRVNP